MTAHLERELKFIADRDTFKTAIALPLLGEAFDSAARAVKSVYFDTDGLDLMRRRIALRVRRMGGRSKSASKRARIRTEAISSVMRWRRHRRRLSWI
jgi:inorganic triphosphatase YgiF